MENKATNLKNDYENNGYLTGIQVLNKNELAEAVQNYSALEQKFGKVHVQYNLHNLHLEYTWVMDLATHPRVLQTITAALGPNIILLDSRFICKYPALDVPHENNVAPFVAWHQDIRYWGFEGGSVASVWLALDDVDQENGVLQVIPGSHKQGLLEHRTSAVAGNMLTSNQEIPEHLIEGEKAIPCPLKAGEMSVHDGLTVHFGEPNFSNRRRCGFVIRYVPTTAYPVDDPDRPRSFPATVLVAGEDKFKHFKDHAPSTFTKTF
ncbi:LOW QUALITY PROTEIN: probable alpha-ketoglutarate-dependent hypophosphite dioxygenase [Pristis pectinata]|uniref:LOW QUALITY PROTEIN: probable alpha-ketoglutarate-dependent hypophosphite dioxygenase n=1 Tax=Pristis pectinata TaxID=685728 RepID=UPI00223D67D7|nr:LOW QUALITY PROTEIN: probable alpha-ketoglutarate-dependent hypophosphite dioxygenase [Pristis pectinata]